MFGAGEKKEKRGEPGGPTRRPPNPEKKDNETMNKKNRDVVAKYVSWNSAADKTSNYVM